MQPALQILQTTDAAAVVGTRSPNEGGAHIGQGWLGDRKTEVFVRLAHALFPSLREFADVNAPLKMMRRKGAERIVEHGRIDGIAFDCEWLLLLQKEGSLQKIPIEWRQQTGSRPPYGQLPRVLRDLIRTRR